MVSTLYASHKHVVLTLYTCIGVPSSAQTQGSRLCFNFDHDNITSNQASCGCQYDLTHNLVYQLSKNHARACVLVEQDPLGEKKDLRILVLGDGRTKDIFLLFIITISL